MALFAADQPDRAQPASLAQRLRGARGDILGAGGVALFALLLRALGLRMGLPYYHHWDEVWITQSARSMLEHHDDLPLSFHYGAPLMVLTAAGFRVVSLFQHVSPGDEVLLRWIGRVLSVAISASGAAAIYLATRPMAARIGLARPRWAALAAGLFYASAAEMVTHARYDVTDAIIAALCAWSLAGASLYGSGRRLGAAIASVVAAGLAFAFKVPGLIVGLIPIGALVVVPARSTWRHRLVLVGAVPALGLIFLALNHHVLTSWQRAFGDIAGRLQQIREGGVPTFLQRDPGLDHLGAALWAMIATIPSRHVWLSLILSAVSVAGLVHLLHKRDPIAAVGVGFAVVALLNLTLPNRAFLVRNYLVEFPVLAVGFGIGVARLAGWLTPRLPARFPVLGWQMAAFAMVVAPSAIALGEAIQNQRLSVDARIRALNFVAASVEAHNPEGTTVAFARTVAGAGAIGTKPHVRGLLTRPGVRVTGDVSSCAEAAASGATYVITASTRSPDPAKFFPYQEEWPFQDCPGFERVAFFPENPYEHSFVVTPTWDGRANALVLRRR
jgi:4-amino-4-deoxy-L-arabinose transferase-like glycosyltransferase